MAYKSPAYLQNLVSLEGSNQNIDYMRAQNELAKEKSDALLAKKKAGSFGARLGRGLTKGLVGGATGALTGLIASGFNPAGALAGAGIGFGAGAIGGAADNGTSPNAVSSAMPALAALGSAATGRYMGNSAGTNFTASDVANEYALDNLTPEDIRMLRMQGRI